MPTINGKQFESVRACPERENWQDLIRRRVALYDKPNDCRDPFERDYTRILHSLAYRRLKHKTQVFFNIENDHICTRMEHVAHVESVACTIAKDLGLSVELTRAIAIGHDLGHAPFGHQGERELSALQEKYLGTKFFHERNGLRFVDDIELLEDDYRVCRNLDLTYAVRDGIISHCGEVDENGLKPRKDYIDLEKEYLSVGQFQPYTWEGCVVKLSDKIAYVGRDIEDARRLGFLTDENMDALTALAREYDKMAINTTVIIHNMIYDVCKNSSPEKGVRLSETFARQLEEIKRFNYEYIYRNKRLEPFTAYAKVVIGQIFDVLLDAYRGEETIEELRRRAAYYPGLMNAFADWLSKFCEPGLSLFENREKLANYVNNKIYGRLETEELYVQAILDFISGMSDTYCIKVFNELITY
ncbi:MAG: HD domain-containing protein [Clostridia bacterium]|nr:HD domain-containing protein [Clostridia bacterium]MBR5410363.1 HD domain-containing protein [Clostridia bacterium]